MVPSRNPTTGPNALKIESPKENVKREPADILVYEAAPLGNQVIDVIGQLVPTLDHDRVARQLVEGTNPTTEPNELEIESPKQNANLEPADILVYEAPPLGNQVIDVIGQLVLTLDHDRVARQLVEGTGCSLKDFCSHHPESFDGRGNHNSNENWLNDVEEVLATTGCTNEQKVAYNAYKLTKEAKRWWQDKKAVLAADLGLETTITWYIFNHEFNQHFFPQVVQKAKA